MKRNVTFFSNGFQISGICDEKGADKAVVVTHPHPLYGGDMHNPVVDTICRCFAACDYTTLRFNFRGVGESEGHFSQGIGEQQDVLSAMDYLAALGTNEIGLAGYSFGTWVLANVVRSTEHIRYLVMVSPPVAFMDFGDIGKLDSLRLVVTGDQDDIAPADLIDSAMTRWNPEAPFERVKGADHFYTGHLDDLAAVISSRLLIGDVNPA